MTVSTSHQENIGDMPWATARQANAIAPSNATVTTALTTKGLLVLTAGNLEIHAVDSAAALAAFAVAAGQLIPIQCKLVRAGTTATVIGLA